MRHLVDRDEPTFADLAAEGLAARRDGRVAGWMLTKDGREAHAAAVTDELAASGAGPAIEEAYQGFLAVNPELLRVCTDWQLRDGAVNDHGDAGYDTRVVKRLEEVHARAVPVLDDLAAALQRLASYEPRLSNALDRVRSGDYEWFTRPLLDSYHTVWFELHEDLLVTLGRSRGDEGRGGV